MVSPFTHWAKVLTAYLLRGEAGLAAIERRLESTAHDRPNGKFGKERALYLPQAPFPPTVWRTSCGRCRFWEAGEPGEPGRCHIVGRDGDRFGGEAIHYRGWCGFWMPPEGEPAFAWLGERLRPDGKSTVRGMYDPALTERKRRRQQRDRAITEPDARRAAVSDDTGDSTRGDASDSADDRAAGTGDDDPSVDDGASNDGE